MKLTTMVQQHTAIVHKRLKSVSFQSVSWHHLLKNVVLLKGKQEINTGTSQVDHSLEAQKAQSFTESLKADL